MIELSAMEMKKACTCVLMGWRNVLSVHVVLLLGSP